jgi:hypothetical protein
MDGQLGVPTFLGDVESHVGPEISGACDKDVDSSEFPSSRFDHRSAASET